jgi:NAD(P)-dependent dehydrogenase (short-subunit alcohol dehydrogenase family)
MGPIDKFTVEDVTKLLEVNFISQFVACKQAIPHLRKTKGNIINMSSCVAQIGQEGGAIYSATKGAICSFTKSLAIEEARHGVRVNCVLPGSIYTESRRQFEKDMGEKGDDINRWAEGLQPMGRSGSAEEVGQVMLFLASDAASYLTGLELLITGGSELGYGLKYPPLFT